MDSDLEVIDVHTHMARSAEHGKEYARYFLARFRGVGPYDYPPFTRPDGPPVAYGTVEEAQQLMQTTGVVHMNFLMFTWAGLYYNDGSHLLPEEPDQREKAAAELKARITAMIRRNNEWALSVVKTHKNLSFFCGIDPAVMDGKDLMQEVADKTSRGALGVKMVPDDSGVRGNDPRLWPVYDYCQSRELPILSQTSSVPTADARPVYFAEALKAFPRLKLICGHAGAGAPGELEVAELTHKYENVHADVSGRMLAEVANGQTTPADMVVRLRRIGLDRLLYGTNFHFVELASPDQETGEARTGPQFTQTRKLLHVLKTLPLTDDERERLASKNFRRLTGLQS